LSSDIGAGPSAEPSPLRQLPQVHRLAAALPHDIPAVYRVEASQGVLGAVRAHLLQHPGDAVPDLPRLAERAAADARRLAMPHLTPVINGTGVILHTNLGRAPLAAAALEQVQRVSAGYSTLEWDVATGLRGSRMNHVDKLLARLTGAEAAMAVNNNAAAVLLALSTMAAGRSVIVSRGQLVEIGGAFRIPDVMRASGARLVEVGTTNKTRRSDYETAIQTGETALLLHVHPSNFRQSGFVESVEPAELAAVGHAAGIPVMTDLGSGVLMPLSMGGVSEPAVREVVAAGVDVVTFSGDKLLGGPQAGLIVGAAEWVAAMRRHPLARAVRLDKMTLAALEVTLRLYVEGREDDIPLWRMLRQSPAELVGRARRLARRVRRALGGAPRGLSLRVQAAEAPVGGGSLPGVERPTAVLVVQWDGASASQLEAALRRQDPPMAVRIVDGTVWVDVRTIAPAEEPSAAKTIAGALRQLGVDADGDNTAAGRGPQI